MSYLLELESIFENLKNENDVLLEELKKEGLLTIKLENLVENQSKQIEELNIINRELVIQNELLSKQAERLNKMVEREK